MRQAESESRWFAICTLPRNERSVARHLESQQIEVFLPTCESQRVWKNRQRVTVVQALFPTYVFARFVREQQAEIFRCPGVRRIVGNQTGPLPIPPAEIEFLRCGNAGRKIEPVQELAVGERVRILRGPMAGLEGTLLRKKNSLRFVLTIELINQSAALEVTADELEPVDN